MIPFLAFLAALLILATSVATAQNPWQSFPDARLDLDEFGDGDSFPVEFERDGKTVRHIVRLYFVDAPETETGSDSDRRRVLEQMRYFGVAEPDAVLAIGTEATALVAERLGKPFTLHTAFANAPGRSRIPRVYGLIETHDGKDLGAELVRAGLARNHGVGRALPDGTPAAEHKAYLGDLEVSAMLGRKGIWAFSDAAGIAELRAEEREEGRQLRQVFEGESSGPVDLNKASQGELQGLPGVGPVLAERIIEARPFDSVEDLVRVRGISENLLRQIQESIFVEKAE